MTKGLPSRISTGMAPVRPSCQPVASPREPPGPDDGWNMGPLRVLFLTNNPNLGSTARVLQDWIRLGQSEGMASHVVAQRSGAFVDWLGANDVPHLVDPMPWPDRWRPWPSLWHGWRVGRWIRRWGIDVVHCNEHDVYPFALALRSLWRRPLVCHVRSLVAKGFCQWAFGGVHRRPDALLWNSEQLRRDCGEAVDGLVVVDRQHVVRLGVDADRFGSQAEQRSSMRKAWGIPEDGIVIGSAAALRPGKRIHDFVELVARTACRHPQVIGLVAGDAPPGDEPYRQRILAAIASTGLGARLRWLGNLEPIEPFLQAIDVFVSTSQYESFGMSVCEAMACGKPVAAYRGGSVYEVLGDDRMVVETGDLGGLEERVERLIRDPDLRRSLGERNRERVRSEFNPRHSLAQLKEIYASLLSPR